MTFAQFERLVRIHRHYADVFTQNFRRLANREPTETEAHTLENAPLVFTLMRLELFESWLSQASSFSEVAAEIEILQREVSAALPDLQRAFEESASKYNFHPSAPATFLALEEELLSHVRKHQLLS